MATETCPCGAEMVCASVSIMGRAHELESFRTAHARCRAQGSHKFKIGDTVWYRSLGDRVKFKIIDRCASARLVLEVVESAYQYDGGWPIGRLMLADATRLIAPQESEVERLRGLLTEACEAISTIPRNANWDRAACDLEAARLRDLGGIAGPAADESERTDHGE